MSKSDEMLQVKQNLELGARQQAQQESISLVEATVDSNAFGEKMADTAAASVLVGRIQMANAVKQFANVGSLQILKNVKETKDYKNLKGLKLPTGEILQGTWAEFCSLIGESKSSVDERLKNLEVFGAEALEAMQSIGMGIRDLRRLRQLPDDELSAIIEGDTLKVTSKDDALDIIEEMAAKHRTKTQQMSEQISTLEENKRATDRLLEDKNKRLLDIEKELEIAKGKGSPAKIKQLEAERFENLRQGVNLATTGLLAAIARFNDAVMEVRNVEHPVDVDDVCTSSIAQVVSRLIDSSSETGLYPDVMAAFKAESDIFSGGNQ